MDKAGEVAHDDGDGAVAYIFYYFFPDYSVLGVTYGMVWGEES